MKLHKALDWSKISYVFKGMLVGAVAGVVVSAFRFSIEQTVEIMPGVYRFLREEPGWILPWAAVLLAAAFFIILLVRDEPDIKGGGIPEIEGQLHGVLQMNWWSVLWRKFVGGILAIGSGLALGREGPSIQLGGTVGQGINRFFKGNTSQQDILISSGAAAGLAAAFNAPLSGLLFVLEEVHHRFSALLILTVFSASVTASFVAYNVFGSEPSLYVGHLLEFPLEHYVHLVVLGILLALSGWVYQKALLLAPRLYRKLRIPPYLHGFVPFLFLIPIGLFLPAMLGGGGEIITTLGQERFTTGILLAVCLFRLLFFQLSYGSGLPGGIFIPSLSIGALLGALYANGALAVTGIEEMYIRSFVIYAMGGFLTSFTKAPLTAVMLITELTGSVTQLMPLAVVCLSSYVAADTMGLDPVYEVLLEKKIPSDPISDEEVDTVEISIEPNSHLDGMEMRDLGLPYRSTLLYIIRKGQTLTPHPDTMFLPGDVLHLLAAKKYAADLKKYMNKVT